MSRSIFGWSYPPGCSGPPDDHEHEPLRCKHCKAFIGGKPEIRPFEDSMQCNGEDCDGMCGGPAGKHDPHKVIWDQGSTRIFKCKRCGKETAA